mgnify:CR=1 FL=1
MSIETLNLRKKCVVDVYDGMGFPVFILYSGG